MWRSWIAGCVAVVAGALFVTACSSDSRSPTEPAPPVQESIVPAGCPSVATTAGYITSLYPAKSAERLVAAAAYAAILLYVNTNHVADARTLVFRLLDYTFTRFNEGKLVGGVSSTTQATLLKFEIGLYCTVGLSTAGLTLPGDPANPGTVNKVIFPSANSQIVITHDGNAGMFFPPNSVGQGGVLVAINPLPSTPPLHTSLDQYGTYSDVKVTPEGSLLTKVTVGLCLTDGIQIPTVFLAHNISSTSIEVLPTGATIDGLCTVQTTMTSGREMLDLALRGEVGRATSALGSAVASLFLPENAYAGSGGKTGLTKTFSPFGGVDTKVYLATNPSPFPDQTAPAGSAVANPPSAIVKTAKGAAVPKVNVLFSVTGGGGTVAGGSSATVATNATGVATVSNWVINAGANSVQAVGTYADPTVTFAAAPPNSGFPQAVFVDPANGVGFTATGGDVVPYGSSYFFLDGAHGFDPTFFTTGSTAGFGTGNVNGPFGTSSTACPLNSDPSINATVFNIDSDLLLIKTFPLPSGWALPLTVEAAIDNDIAVWVNGHPLTTHKFSGDDAVNYTFDSETGLVKHENCATKGSLTFTVPASFLVAGQNTLAIRAQDRGGLSYVDAKVTAPVPVPPSQ